MRRALFLDEDGRPCEKDTKTHKQRRIVLASETVNVLREHLDRCRGHVAALGLELVADVYVFSRSQDGSAPLLPDTVTQRYERMARKLKDQDDAAQAPALLG